MKMLSTEAIVAMLREQARMRAEENDERGVLFHHAHQIQRDVDQINGCVPFDGLDACETE